MKTEILVIDDDESIRMVVRHQLVEAGYGVHALSHGGGLKGFLKEHDVSIAIIDNKLPQKSGAEILKEIKEVSPHVVVIFMTAFSNVELAVEVMKTGAFDFLTKPVSEKSLLMSVRRAEEVSNVYRENRQLKDELKREHCFESILTASESMAKVITEAKQAALTDAAVLITGETGTGKELIAHCVHSYSERSGKPFIPINCGAIPENLLESELFGYKKGAFTGADHDKQGKIIKADGGTLFLDEIGELPPSMQVKLLRFLQDKKIEILGEAEPFEVDVRIVAATNRDLHEGIDEETFRSDLYYRLSVIPLHLPPLSARREDIPLLAKNFVDEYCCKYNKKIRVEEKAMKALTGLPWPGNIRQMRNVIERMVILNGSGKIHEDDIPTDASRTPKDQGNDQRIMLPDEGVNLEELEKSLLIQALDKSAGNQSKAARLLGMTRNTFLYRLGKFDIKF